MLRVGLIGYPVGHSLSPSFQQPALDALGIEARYDLWPTPPDEVPDRIMSLREPDVLGANVTVPHKAAVVRFLDEVSASGQRAGAVNTVIPRAGRLLGENTDIYGLARSLREAGLDAPGFSAILLGAGGAARGAVLALESLGAAQITVANRTLDRADALLALVPEISGEALALNADGALREVFRHADVVINATSLGWNDEDIPIDRGFLDELPSLAVVMDLTYRETPFLAAARARGLATIDGLPMLVYQGARSFELWTGRDAPVELMMAAALEARSTSS
ncbi:MAG: shikimate dehydrogenase [Thermomicrobiales bacterium]